MSRSRWTSGFLLTLALPFSLATQAQPLAVAGVLQSPAMRTVNATHAVFSSVVRAEDRLVAVGERGLILLSDDNGLTWRQASVPVSVGLTAVQFVDAQHGWAVGHGGVVLFSEDGGESWQVQLEGHHAAELELLAAQQAVGVTADVDAAQARVETAQRLMDEGADKPLLNLHFTDQQHGLVVGAYGMALRTADGGRTWQSVAGQIDNPTGLHLYAVAQQGRDWYLAGEQGFLARSSDDGRHFEQLPSPYEGTFFTLVPRQDGSLLLGGLKGNVFLIRSAGRVIEPLEVPTPVSFSDGTRLDDGRVLLANQVGAVFVLGATSHRLQQLIPPQGRPLAGLAQAADGSLVAAGFTGLAQLSSSAAKVSE
ncbi:MULTISPECIES: WD40/YVTN/BNR-like repeat-containing protein [Pseudomonas]|uniref:WD40/YVTN/BNR-like repeat-containing protein n=1 Tax=Pseudomonas TaxID=286 RepID=UPI000D95BCEC|nr:MULTISPECIES: YCF48-related protein [Pseudomonas]MBH3384619.1 BNR domain-containing protein [Pseudomonas juntendi]MBR7521488.1 BNR domain-containing protein [Pseudomonas juntendi]PYB96750.1 BNR domain-containing protein [Pseudomonas sp. MB-090624]WBM35413.1 YCF48-related protein [Pseudomonas sp. NY11382]